MRTIIQEPENGYDIDDGVVFTTESLKGPRGGQMLSLAARKMVCNAIRDSFFNKPPEVKRNCVRIYYNDGPHVDIPVYRKSKNHVGNIKYELASTEWIKTDPRGVNDWFKNWLKWKKRVGQKHSRELIRLMKSICKSRPSISLPSGFVITVLIKECYNTSHERLDLDLRHVIDAIHSRLGHNLWVHHPVVQGEALIDSRSEHKTRNLMRILASAENKLRDLDFPNCTRHKALLTWKNVLSTDFFDKRINEAKTSSSF